MYFGAPFSDASSMKSKSKTRFKDAITTMKSDINMLVIDPFKGFKISKLKPKNTPTIDIK